MTVYMIDLGWERDGKVNKKLMEELDKRKEYYNDVFYQRAFTDYSKAKKLAEEVVEEIAKEVEGHNGSHFIVEGDTLVDYLLTYETDKYCVNFYVFITFVETE